MDYFSLPEKLAPDSRMELAEMDEKVLDYHEDEDVFYFQARSNSLSGENYRWVSQIEIPDKEGQIKQLLRFSRNHKGLKSALISLKNGRSPHTASIVLLGETGGGKSSTVNTLFQNKNLAKIDHEKSCTKEIVEYEIKIPMKDLGVTNGSLKIIDTPGFGDTAGTSNHADQNLLKILITYFKTHPMPSIVLIVAKFTDNRYNDKQSGFVKTLQLVESLRKSVFKEDQVNYILVLTHLMSEKPGIRNEPAARCESFANAVPNYTSMAKPPVVLAENCPEDWELPMVNGFSKLPNGKYYPINLYREIEGLLKNVDPMADAIIYAAFKNISKFQIKTTFFPLENMEKPNIQTLWVPEPDFHWKSEISRVVIVKVDEFWTNSNIGERNNFLIGMLWTLNRLKIKTLKDLPFNKGRSEILELMRQFECHPMVPKVFRSLNLNIPCLNFENGLFPGRGYNSLKMEIVENSENRVFEKGEELIPTPLGYLIPGEFKFSETNQVVDICEIYDTKSLCMVSRLKHLNVITQESCIDEVRIPYKAQVGYNVIDSKTIFTGLREHRLFKISLQENNLSLSSGFVKDLADLPEFDRQIANSVQHFHQFFNKYGTHVVEHYYGGGAIIIALEAKGISQIKSSFSKGAIDWSVIASFLKKFIEGDEDFGEKLSQKEKKQIFQSCSVSYKGGLDGYQFLENLFSTNLKQKTSLVKSWVDSLKNEPVVLSTRVKLVPLSFYVKLLFEGDEAVAKSIHCAIEYFLRQKLHCHHATISTSQFSAIITDPVPSSHEFDRNSTLPSARNETRRINSTSWQCCPWF